MKRVISITIAVCFVILLVSCKTSNTTGINEANSDSSSEVVQLEEKVKRLEDELEKVQSQNLLTGTDLQDLEYNVHDKHYHYMEVHDEKIYVIYRRENPDDQSDWADALWCFSPIETPNKIIEGKGIDFRVSPNNKHIAVNVNFNNSISIFDSEGNLEKEFTEEDYNIRESCNINLGQWNDTENILWLESKHTYVTDTFIRININTWETNSYPNEYVFTDDLALNPNTGWIVYSDYPVFLDIIGSTQYKESGKLTTLFLYNVETQERLTIDSQVTNLFSPKWISDNELVYMYGDEIRNYILGNEEKDKDSILDYGITKENFADVWHSTWESIIDYDELMLDIDIEKINYLLQPVLPNNEFIDVNPLSCFFTSYYKDIRDINLTEFLRYFPYGEVPNELPEFEELKKLENWPFRDDITFSNMMVPIHRYKNEAVQDVFTEYTSITLDELTGVGFDGVFYLESTNAYYNYTSDFGPGVFICKEVKVEDGVIELYGDARNGTYPILTIAKNEDKYVIQSFYVH
jgi:hypothetical protein